MSAPAPTGAVERAWRTERAQIVATLARRLGDLALAEDAVQDAFVRAVARWPADGVPDRPGAWLLTTAWRRALDLRRRAQRQPPAGPGAFDGVPDPAPRPDGAHLRLDGGPVADDLLGLVLACCHPALAPEARVALTLRHVAGLTAGEIAAAFLVSDAAMAKRLVRARSKLRDAGVSFAVPPASALPARLADAQAVVYLVFTEGHYASGDGPPVRAALCDEAVWLARRLYALAPDDAETTGLLALLLLLHARHAARLDGAGRLVPLADQDRARWDAALIEEARALLATTGRGPLGPYQVEAAIAALHAAAADAAATPWPRIAELYGVLDRLAPSPVVTVNRAVAVRHADGPEAGLALLDPILAAGRLADYAPLHATHADLLEALGQRGAARAAWQRAAACTTNPDQRRELLRRAERDQ